MTSRQRHFLEFWVPWWILVAILLGLLRYAGPTPLFLCAIDGKEVVCR